MEDVHHNESDGAHATLPPGVASDPAICMSCHKAPKEYASSTCHHELYCKKCAMKCATGGRCKICGEMFPDLRRI